jgi:hypothetical protein
VSIVLRAAIDWKVCSCKQHHREERAHGGPRNSDDGLFVANRNIPRRQDIEQLSVVPEVTPLLALGTASLDYKLVFHEKS